MKIAIQYVSDMSGNTQAVQLPIAEWEKVLQKLSKYEQELKFKSDIKIAFEEVSKLKTKKGKKQTLRDFLDEI